jgi:hypothetical protein
LLAVHYVDDAGFLYKDDGTVVSDLNSGQLRNRANGKQNPLINDIANEVRKGTGRAYNRGVTRRRPA